ncbi:ninjurin-2-like isoform X3 [Homarus americanus]|uniref:ninjurin-2-like isoform X3 n=1 Tax=Homarus americanus TaxID=6706 RepID=UPI001C44A602|nr:ninjurin-2-like isoform X3 [Homarus americanus]XP_042212419.1 ninjurin-2-like isoform X3 [Homarus americanus]
MSVQLFTPTYKTDGVTYNNSNGTMSSIDPQVMTVGGGKRLDANNYATKKTVAQGMLDVALLTANASQLKYVLEVGEKHPYYTAMIILISFSLVLQGLTAILLGVLAVFNINKPTHQYPSVVINHVVMGLNMLIMALDAIQAGFDNGFRPVKNSTTFIP